MKAQPARAPRFMTSKAGISAWKRSHHLLLSARWLGGAGCTRNMAGPARLRAAPSGADAHRGRRHCWYRHHQPARDDGGVGPPHGAAGLRRSSGSAAVPPNSARNWQTPARDPDRGRHGPGDRRLLLREQDPLDSGDVPGARQRASGGDLFFGNIRHMADLEPDQRRRPRHRSLQRIAHDAVSTWPAAIGTTQLLRRL